MKRFLRTSLTLLALSILAACGGSHPYGIPEQFGDSDPVIWKRGHTPAGYPVHGVDVSRYQGQIDWPSVAGGGVSFAFIKATEGGDVVDPMFLTNWVNASSAGLPRGAYHFYYFCRTAAEQAAWFIQHVPNDRAALPPVLDMEWTQSRNCPHRPSPEVIRAEAQTFLSIIGAYYGKLPIIYTSVDFWQDNELWRVSGYPFWLRSVAAHPRDIYAGHHWTFWQYTGTGNARGFSGPVDLNAFGGSSREWQDWLAANRQ